MINHSTLDYHVTNFNIFSRWLCWRNKTLTVYSYPNLNTDQNTNPNQNSNPNTNETFKIKKLHTPSLLNELLPLSTSSRRKLLLKVQINTNLSVTQHNFIYKAAQVWNKMIQKILNSPELDIGSGVVIPGSFLNSDLTTPIPFIKNRVKKMLHEMQRLGDTVQWLSDGSNFSI